MIFHKIHLVCFQIMQNTRTKCSRIIILAINRTSQLLNICCLTFTNLCFWIFNTAASFRLRCAYKRERFSILLFSSCHCICDFFCHSSKSGNGTPPLKRPVFIYYFRDYAAHTALPTPSYQTMSVDNKVPDSILLRVLSIP